MRSVLKKQAIDLSPYLAAAERAMKDAKQHPKSQNKRGIDEHEVLQKKLQQRETQESRMHDCKRDPHDFSMRETRSTTQNRPHPAMPQLGCKTFPLPCLRIMSPSRFTSLCKTPAPEVILPLSWCWVISVSKYLQPY